MSDTIFLTPSGETPDDIVSLAQICKENLLLNLKVCIVDEDLRPNSDNTVFSSKFENWLETPEPKIVAIDDTGVETLKFETTDYTADLAGGTVTFTSATTDLIRASFEFFPFTDEQITELVKQSLKEIEVLVYRKIDPDAIHSDYIHAICKRLYTNVLKALLLEAKDYFRVSIGDRNVDKTNVVTQFDAIIDQNEKQLEKEVETLRHYNKTNRLIPSFEITKQIKSDAEVI